MIATVAPAKLPAQSDGLALDLATALDPALVLRRMGFVPDQWQEDLLRSTAQRILMNIHRQAGKSTVIGALAAHTAVYQPDSLVLVLSPGLRQSQELFRKCLDAYHALGGAAPADAETALRLELVNGSRIISLPGKEETVRGYSGVRLLLVDEAARVPNELYMSVRPMLAVSGGRLIAPSTPFGKRGWWYEAWSSDQVWERVEIPATRCPRIAPEFLAEERAALGMWYPQEYECQFIQAEGSVFMYEDIRAMLSADVQPIVFGQ